MRSWITGICLCLALVTVASAQDVSTRLAQLHDDLSLTAEQESAWRDYTISITQSAEVQSRRQATQMLLPQLATPRRLALLDATMTQDLTDFHRQSQAILAFYTRLSLAQQRTFDRETLPPQNQESNSGEDRTIPPHTLRMPPP